MSEEKVKIIEIEHCVGMVKNGYCRVEICKMLKCDWWNGDFCKICGLRKVPLSHPPKNSTLNECKKIKS